MSWQLTDMEFVEIHYPLEIRYSSLYKNEIQQLSGLDALYFFFPQ